MTKLEVAKEIIKQEGRCCGIDCADCIKNKEGIYPCVYVGSLNVCDGSKDYRKAKVDFCKEWIKENEVKFKVGDWVSSEYFEGIKQIDDFVINCAKEKRALVLGEEGRSYSLENLTLVCGFVKGEIIEGSNTDIFCNKGVFDSYRPDLEHPFVAVHNHEGEKFLQSYKYARAIKPKYKQYEKANYDWIGKRVTDDFGVTSTIKMVGKDCVNFKENDKEETCYDLFKHYTWLSDGSICGEPLN